MTGLPLRTHWPVVILGGGINGCGLFRDLCLQGVETLIVDRGDWCSGASAAPSRLIHGGIKYLETGEFRLVKQSLTERNLLLANAPHAVKPLPTVLPIRSVAGGIVPSVLRFLGRPARMADRGALITEVGLRLYDLYGRRHRTMPSHRLWGRRRLRAEMPDLDPALVAAGLYYEARITHAERLGLELVQDGLADLPASAARSHTAVVDARRGRIRLEDQVTGERFEVTADVVVNAGGAWIDKVNRAMGIESRHMGGNKGSHVVVRHPALLAALRGRMVYFGSADGRVNLLYPFMDTVLIGSTDIPVQDPDAAVVTEEEIAYLLGTVAEVFPGIPIPRESVVHTYCGVRPLPRSDSVDPGLVSRDHSIAEDRLPGSDTPVLCLIGGKWTTFRGFAEEAADRILTRLGRPRRAGTEDLPIGGGRGYPPEDRRPAWLAEIARESGLGAGRVADLADRYGTTARAVALWCGARGDPPLTALPDHGAAELDWIVRHEGVRRLEDLLFRRTDLALTGRLDRAAIEEAAAVAASALGWDAPRTADEVRRCAARLGLLDTAVDAVDRRRTAAGR